MSDPTVVSPTPANAQDETLSVVKAAGLVGVATFSSRILGFVRDMVLARIFGATPAADAFFVAYRVPNLLRELFAEGSMSSAFIPVFTEYQTLKSRRDTWELASAVFTTLLTIVIGITILGIIVASGIVWLLAPGFHDDPAKLGMTTLLTQIMFPYLVFISLAALAMGILNSMRAFAAPAFSPVFFNIFIIGCALFLSPMMAEPILGVAIGVVAGGAAQFAMQLPGLSLRGMLFGFRFKPSHPGVRRIGVLMVPSLLGLSVTQINITVSTILASFFAGGPTYLFYGMRLIQFPLGIFGVALATAILPTLSAQAARGALDELRTTLGFGLRMILFIILPAMLGLILLRQPIVHLFFEHGTFTAHDTADTALAAMVNGGILVAVLHRRLGGVEWSSVGRSSLRVLLASVPLVVVCAWVAAAPVWTQPGEWAAKSVMLCVAIGLSVSGYLGVHALLRSEELDLVWGMVRRKLKRGVT